MDVPEIRLGSLTLQPGRQLLANGTPVPLSRKPLEILTVLANARGELVTKDELMKAVWPRQVVEESAIHVHVVALRKALGADAVRLKTVHGFGYRLEGCEADTGASAPPARSRQASIAVLPFANLTGDPSKAYLAEGVAEELITTLSHAGGLKVSSRTSSFAYRDRALDVREIGRQLGVGAIVEGSLRAGDGRIRLTVQLIDAGTGFHLWSGNFDRSLTDLLELQDELAHSVAAALGRELKRGARGTGSAEAMRLLLQARAMASRLSGDGLAGAQTLLRRAIALDPSFAGAHEGLAGALLLAISAGETGHEAREEARREAERALAIDAALPVARYIIACLDAMQGDWLEAERHFIQALEQNAADPLLHEAFANFVLFPTGSIERASKHADRSLELAPARTVPHLLLALCEVTRGDITAAARALETATMLGVSEQLSSYRALRAYILVLEGRADEAGAEVAAALPGGVRAAGGKIVKTVYRAFGGLDDPAEASTLLSALFDGCRSTEAFWRDPALLGIVFGGQAALGSLNEAYRVTGSILDRWRKTRHLATPILNSIWLPTVAPFRADPRFQGFVEALGMLEYWAEAGPPDGYTLVDGRLV